jgi:hypothetical protein
MTSFMLVGRLSVDDERDPIVLGVDFFIHIDQGIRTDDAIFDHRALLDDRAIHDDGVLAAGPFFDQGLARDDAMVDRAETDGALVDEGVGELGFRADVLRVLCVSSE